MSLSTLPTLSLLLDSDILQRNLQRMQDRADRLKVRLRPHLNTHKCLQVARWQERLGAKGVTVSTFYEAKQFAAAGFSDILWAFPLPPVYASASVFNQEDETGRQTTNWYIDSTPTAGWDNDDYSSVTGIVRWAPSRDLYCANILVSGPTGWAYTAVESSGKSYKALGLGAGRYAVQARHHIETVGQEFRVLTRQFVIGGAVDDGRVQRGPTACE